MQKTPEKEGRREREGESERERENKRVFYYHHNIRIS